LNSPRRSQDRPIESVALRIVFRADRETTRKIREKVPSATVRRGACEVNIKGSDPRDVADKARDVLEKIRGVA
jgi:hypothetical protein